MKKNIRKIPAHILQRIKTFGQDDVVAATVKLVRTEDVGLYQHLNIQLKHGRMVLPEPALPDPNAGKYSDANVHGKEVVRKDLPKYKKEFGFWAPSWKSSSEHWVSHEREVYHRDFYPPKEALLALSLLEERQDGYLVKFSIEQVINRRTKNFELELLYNLNLLQENVGAASVYESTATIEEFRASVQVDWQLLPPGSVDEVVEAMTRGKQPINEGVLSVMKERVGVISELQPEAYITGTDGFLRYFGAKFDDDFIVFENVKYGNAIYVLYEDWEELSKKSRFELLSGNPDGFDRIIHTDGWAEKLSSLLEKHRRNKTN